MRLILAIILALLPGLPAVAQAPVERSQNYFQILFDMTHSGEQGFRPGFGYSVFVQYEGKRLLFDLGADAGILEQNMKAAGIDPATLDAVAISHNHPDHSAGLSILRKHRPNLAIYVPPGQDFDSGKLIRLRDSVAITPNLMLLRTHTETPTVGISDEISLLIRTAQGPYLITACSHTSVATIVDKSMKLAEEEIYHYIGGARLKMRGVEDTKKVAADLKASKVKHVSPGHCSVDHNVGQVFKEVFPLDYAASRLGRKAMLSAPGS